MDSLKTNNPGESTKEIPAKSSRPGEQGALLRGLPPHIFYDPLASPRFSIPLEPWKFKHQKPQIRPNADGLGGCVFVCFFGNFKEKEEAVIPEH